MNTTEWTKLWQSKLLILDGATGSNLQMRGMPSGVCPEQWILEHPDILCGLQKEYLAAGTDILYTPTFSGNRFKLAEYGLEQEVERMNRELAAISLRAVREYREETKDARPLYVAGNMTMTGRQLPPVGMTDFEELVTVYREQAESLAKAGADLIVIETMMSLAECRAALLAAKESTSLPVVVTLTFNEDGHTLYGTDPETAVIVMQSMGADAVGVNCSSGPDRMTEWIRRMKQYARVPLIAKPNAGLPRLENGRTVFDMGPEEFAAGMERLIEEGAVIVGGCCGTTPDHIRALVQRARSHTPGPVWNQPIRVLTTQRSALFLNPDERFYLVGERINPTGKKELSAQLKAGETELACEMAREQEENGADILDINVGMSGIDEKETILAVLEEVQLASSLPLSIDTSSAAVMEAALRRYPGRALVNSISLEKDRMSLLPIVKKYGAMFILLPLSEKGIPETFEEKKQIIETIANEAFRLGFSREDIIVDALIHTAGANPEAGRQALHTIRWCREQGFATIAGLSNISYGLPGRPYINSTFLAMAIGAGLSMAIANPAQELLRNTALAADLLMGREGAAIRYIDRIGSGERVMAGKTPAAEKSATAGTTAREEERVMAGKPAVPGGTAAELPKEEPDGAMEDLMRESLMRESPLYQAVLKGNRRGIVELTRQGMEQYPAERLLNACLIPAINEVGVLFDRGIYYLPQLIASAEAMKAAIDYLEPSLYGEGSRAKLGTVIAATVAGDIHDIGKNLVVLMLKNYGFEVIDLGKDVPSARIIEEAKRTDADLIALSALMTTTMQEMREVVRLRNEAGIRAKVMIGGAVTTQSYADEIGADGYSANARDAALTARRLLEEGK